MCIKVIEERISATNMDVDQIVDQRLLNCLYIVCIGYQVSIEANSKTNSL